ncbi:MAG: hypothetical protein A2X51_15145 [Candidatus Rokubacteria bacterium GWC2_70_24]|nr:MAG: hypothetical protein A2X53_14910 [Candidatus Rokubacteria bacterium GWA2_70_23]OGK88649.1 MAG: hypothetical protein A2X51_15145 [Candidatus Rokubacteria bacterium GWC2_70_24]
MTFPRGLRALNHRDFRRFFLAQLVAQSGTWMQTVAQSWLVLQLTDSPLKLGLIGTLQFAPMLLFSIATGALADRVPKRRLLVGTQAALACQALALALLVASGHVQYWHVAVLGFFTGLANVMDQPARQSFVAELVGKNDTSLQLEAPDALRGRVMSLYTLVWGGVFPFGAFLVGAMSEGWGVSMALLVNGTAGLAGLAAILAWWRRRAPARAEGPGATAR